MREAKAELRDAYEAAGRAANTIALFDRTINALVTFCEAYNHPTDITAITPRHVEAFIAHERKRGLKPASLSITHRTLKRFFAFAVERRIITENPMTSVMGPRVTIEPVKFVTDEAWLTLKAYLEADDSFEGRRDLALLLLLSDTGARRGEVVGLRVQDVDVDQRLAYIRPETSKTRRGRTVVFSAGTATALRSYMRARTSYMTRNARESVDALWLARKGALTPNGALQALHARCDAAGVERVSLHSFRHRMAAHAIQQGLPMPYLMAAGGWTSPTQPTVRYGQFAIQDRAIEAMRDMLAKR